MITECRCFRPSFTSNQGPRRAIKSGGANLKHKESFTHPPAYGRYTIYGLVMKVVISLDDF